MSSETPVYSATIVVANPSEPAAIATSEPATKTSKATITADSPIPDAIVRTERIIIRPIHPQDAASMSKHANSPEVAKHMSLAFPSPYTIESAHTWINLNLTPPLNHYAIALSSSPSSFIGGIGMLPGRDVASHTAEVGYWIGTEFAGQGIVTEVLEGFTNWVFGERGDNGTGLSGGSSGSREVRRLFAEVFAPHKASMRILEKCGYLAEGVMKGHAEKFGEVMDVHVYGLTKEHWEERRQRV